MSACHRSDSVPILLRAAVTLLVAVGAMLATATPSLASTPKITLDVRAPDTAAVGERILLVATFENTGLVPLTGDFTFSNTFPEGMEPTMHNVTFSHGLSSCELVERTLHCTAHVDGLLPGSQVRIWMTPVIEPTASGDLVVSMKASGGGITGEIQAAQTVTVGKPNPFAVKVFSPRPTDAEGNPMAVAGAHPDLISTDVYVPSHGNFLFDFFPVNAPSEQPRNFVVHLPPGLIGNPQATPTQCSGVLALCPLSSQVGFARVFHHEMESLYNMEPPPGVPAQFGFEYQSVRVILQARVRPNDYGFDLVLRNTTTSLPVDGAHITFWGIPADPSNDTRREGCTQFEGNVGSTCPVNDPREAFLRLPTSCIGPLQWSVEVDSYQHPESYVHRATTTPAQTGCQDVPFTPSASVEATTNAADSPTGLKVRLSIPQQALTDPDSIAQSDLRNAIVKLPESFTINPAAAGGLASCSSAQIALDTNAQPTCPDASKIGSISIDTPLLPEPLEGSIYLAAQGDNPFGSLLAMYLVAEGSGVVLKLPGKIEADPDTGQLTTSFVNQPQQPFSELEFKLDGGPRAVLRTPVSCGSNSAEVTLAPWSGNAPVELQLAVPISAGPAGSPCPKGDFDPVFHAGTENPLAGAHTPFNLRLTRSDGSREIGGITATLPPGLFGKLAGIPYCSDATLGAISSGAGTAAAEIARPSCPQASRVGTVTVGAGAGPSPFYTSAGRVYLAGPYKGAPLSLALVVPSVAGPLDLGSVVVRNALRVDPERARITTVSDPLPRILHGIPLDLRDIRVELDRPEFTLNPTSCREMAVDANLTSTQGDAAQRSARFQVGACDRLRFKPKLLLRLKGGTQRGDYPALRATVTMPKGTSANIARTSVALPRSEFLAQSHIRVICTRVQFAAGAGNGTQCPKGSVYGRARAFSPLLDHPLEGPVYLRSSDHPLPDLVAALHGQIDIHLIGRIDTSKAGGIRTTFAQVPDAPVSKFVLNMQGGKKGLLENSANLCRRTRRATVRMRAHNGRGVDSRPKVKASCRAKKHKKQRATHRGSHR